jgi:hypothetical protein
MTKPGRSKLLIREAAAAMFQEAVNELARVLDMATLAEVAGIEDDMLSLSVALERALASGAVTSADPLALDLIRRVVSELSSS